MTSPAAGKRVEGTQGMVVASQAQASEAGAAMLRAGGNAVDAAVAAAFALSVVDISQTGLGGGGALTWYDARTHHAEHLSFYSRTGADPLWGEQDSTRSAGRAAAVPGMVAGLLEAHGRFGRLARAQVMAPAIRLAREGFVVSPLLSRTITSSREKLAADSSAFALFFPGGEALRPGDQLMQPELAGTLERIASEGASGFYRGPVAADLVRAVQARGGLITEGDLADYPVADMRPLCTMWRGYTVLSAPPPMGGAPVLAMLNLAQETGLADAGGFTDVPDAAVRFADIHRLVSIDASRWRGDPAILPVPARGFVSPAYAKARAAILGSSAADTVVRGDPWPYDTAAPQGACAVDPFPAAARLADDTASASIEETGGSLTSHLSVVDADGNAVSATTTVGVLFGSGVYTDGFFLNSSAANLDARTRGPNRYSNSTIAPTLILDGDRVRLVVGAAGSQYIQSAIVEVTLRILAYGEDPGTAVAAPRLQTSVGRRDVEVEPGFTPEVYAALVRHGYRPLSRVADIAFGGVHAVYVRRDGKVIGAADPRRDGVAVKQ
ncbi:MAG: gamma-glutamyltransferase family protein [Gemmatimonadota bacterium]|nr:gamma-glutamyltransferase family protein [Gemmatimonadota bacterium]